MENFTGLVDFGALGLMVLACFGVIIWLAKQQKSSIQQILEDKDRQIESWKESAENRGTQLDGVLSQLTDNSKRLIDLYEHQQQSINSIPERTVEKLQIALKK